MTRKAAGGRRRRLVAPLLAGLGAGLVATAVLLRRRGEAWVEGPRWYGFVYRTFYLLGLRVWDRGTPAPELVELVEGSSSVPPGRALDIGCGTGTESIYLAEHGWDVTGVDMVPRALAIARRKAATAGVSPRFVQGDVTRLRDFGIGDGYILLLDFGCFHTIPPDQRDAYVEGVSQAAAPGSTFLLFGFRPPRLAPMRAGVTTEEVRERFHDHGWELVSAERKSIDEIEVAGKPADELFELWGYALRRLPV
ncbi:MAG: methyltransferase domain-containing protein [Streptosporangiales bacterium]|nr:methyltransferase domain-containing protein [Streptosporangiales bacterium]